MKYLSCSDAAKAVGITPRRIQQMCMRGEIPGAVKDGRSWMIPEDAVLRKERKKPLPIGVSDFKAATTDYYYVDKTLLIRDFLDTKPKVSLFTRPRRFGKTLNMDMLRTFFERTEEDTSVYFRDKKIWACGQSYRNEQGKYPVIFLTFKDVKFGTWEETIASIRSLVAIEAQRHEELGTSSKCNNYDKEIYDQLASGKISEVGLTASLKDLSRMLQKHYGCPAIIIIDEYDTPIQQGHSCNFYDEIVGFMRNFFSGGLKDNPNLAYGFLTGILRVAKESIFSGLNNLKTNSILDDPFSEYFGFTPDEVKELLQYYGKAYKFQEVCDWYDGYRFGNSDIFNPWSVINYVSDNCFPKAFWQSTGSNDIIGEIISAATPEITEGLHKLLCGEKITTYVDTSVIYPEVQSNPFSIYSFLLIAGYLKVAAVYPQFDGNFMCDVAIPNKEIAYVYEKEVLNRTNQNGVAISIQQAIFSGDAVKLQNLLEDFMLHSISSMDSANESFYHGMMLGLCAVLGNRYQVRSNRESGLGRFDIQLTPQVNGLPGFLFEFKHTNDAHADLDTLADAALRQIDDKKYDTELHSLGVHSIVKIGIAFRGKKAVVKCQ